MARVKLIQKKEEAKKEWENDSPQLISIYGGDKKKAQYQKRKKIALESCDKIIQENRKKIDELKNGKIKRFFSSAPHRTSTFTKFNQNFYFAAFFSSSFQNISNFP